MENVVKSCLICARIHSTIDYRNIKLVIAVYPFQINSLDTRCVAYRNDSKFNSIVSVDHFTHWIKVRVLKKETSEKDNSISERFCYLLAWVPCKDSDRWRETICLRCNFEILRKFWNFPNHHGSLSSSKQWKG